MFQTTCNIEKLSRISYAVLQWFYDNGLNELYIKVDSAIVYLKDSGILTEEQGKEYFELCELDYCK